MQCDYARILMDERLDGGEAPGLRSHVFACGDCAATWAELRAAEGLLSAQELVEVPPHLTSRVMSYIETETRQMPEWRRTLMQIALIAVGAVLLALATAAFVHGWAQVLTGPSVAGQMDGVFRGAGVLSGMFLDAFGRAAMEWLIYGALAVALALVWFGALVVPRFAPRPTLRRGP
jgi:hypothetical protein